MAAAGNAMRLCLRTCRQPASPLLARGSVSRQSLAMPRRTLTTTRSLLAGGPRDEMDDPMGQRPWEHIEDAFKDLTPEQLKQLEKLVGEDEKGQNRTFNEAISQDEHDHELHSTADRRDLIAVLKANNPRVDRTDFGYDESDPEAAAKDPEDSFNEDDITEQAHGKLDELREYRHYARIAAWEMPLLSSEASSLSPLSPPPRPTGSACYGTDTR